MADYFMELSVAIGKITPKERKWLEEFLDGTNLSDEQYDDFVDNEYDSDSKDLWPHCEYKWIDADDGLANLWFYSSESFSVTALGHFMQEYLKKFHPNKYLAFEWSNTCSKPRLDAYGGGAVFVTATDIEVFSTYDFLYRKMQEHKELTER